MKRAIPATPQLLLDFGIIFTAMSRGQTRRNLAKREKEESGGGKHEAVTTVQEDRDVFFDDVNDDDGDDECQKMDESIYTNEEDRNDDVRVGKNMVESIKALMESNKRLRTENALLRQDLNVIRVIADPQSPDSGQEKKKKRKRRFSRS